jgi:hypothetical protein
MPNSYSAKLLYTRTTRVSVRTQHVATHTDKQVRSTADKYART